MLGGSETYNKPRPQKPFAGSKKGQIQGDLIIVNIPRHKTPIFDNIPA